jgi:hypothetical protein
VNEAAKHLTCGALSAVVSRTAVAPLERLKMEVILNTSHHNSWQRAASHVWQCGGATRTLSLPLGPLLQMGGGFLSAFTFVVSILHYIGLLRCMELLQRVR